MYKKTSLVCLLFIHSLEADDMSSLLFNGNCITCHKETESVSAPSIIEVRKRYQSVYKTKEEFVEQMSNWVEHPNSETSIMQDAVKKYSLMPDLGFDKETIIDISRYIYETDFTSRGGRYWSK